MYAPHDQWSVPEEGDPPPCFRQGDLLRLTWVRPEHSVVDGGRGVRMELEVRPDEIVAVVGACCDLVLREPAKRKGFWVSPLRAIPKQIAKKPAALEVLRATLADLGAGDRDAFPNHVYYAATSGPDGTAVPEGVLFLEAIATIDAPLLRSAVKIAELTPTARFDFKERLKWHATRGAP